MKRNKRTEQRAHEELAPLTERILAQMGEQGADLRRQLKRFYRERASLVLPPLEPGRDGLAEAEFSP